MNLQLFATNTGTSLSAEMKTFYDLTLIDEAGANLVHHQFGQKRPIPANGGKTIEFRKFSATGIRPQENGTAAQSGAVTRPDVSRMSKSDRQAIIRRVQQGEKISF